MSYPVVKETYTEVLVKFPHDNSDEQIIESVRNAQALLELASKSNEQNIQKAQA